MNMGNPGSYYSMILVYDKIWRKKLSSNRTIKVFVIFLGYFEHKNLHTKQWDAKRSKFLRFHRKGFTYFISQVKFVRTVVQQC